MLKWEFSQTTFNRLPKKDPTTPTLDKDVPRILRNPCIGVVWGFIGSNAEPTEISRRLQQMDNFQYHCPLEDLWYKVIQLDLERYLH